MKETLLSEGRITLIHRYYGFPPKEKQQIGTISIERIIKVNDTTIFTCRAPRKAFTDTIPVQFEQWVFNLYHLAKKSDCRHNGRPDGGYLLRRFKLMGRNVFRKVFHLKP